MQSHSLETSLAPQVSRVTHPGGGSGLIAVTDRMLAPPVICSAEWEVGTQPLTVSLSDSRTKT